MENLYVDEVLICYVNYLCQLMSGQIVKKTDLSDDLKGKVLLKKTNYFQHWVSQKINLIIFC